MARTKNRPGTAPSAAHAATDPAPASVTAPAPDSPAAAVHAALAANPGGTVTAIADAAGTGKPAARDALLAMEKDGTAARVKGGKPGIPDTWTLADPASDDASPAEAGPEDAQPGESADGTASRPAGPGDETAGEAVQDGAAETASPVEQDADAEAAPEAEDDAPGGDEDTADGERDEAVPDSGDGQEHGDGPREDDPPEDPDGEADDAPDPSLVSAIIERIDQIRAAADGAELVLTASGDLKTALAGMDEIYEQAAEARRSLKAATSGRKAPAVRPGGLRDKVLAHLDEHPDKEFTPHEIHKVLDHSSGAIANALDTLVKLGEAEVATEKPRRFRRAAQPAGAAPHTDGTDSADGAQEAGTELAGAA